ncbi:unnamed protein product [Ectocarpus sp. 8 AP-2014]
MQVTTLFSTCRGNQHQHYYSSLAASHMRRSMSISCCSGSPPARTAGVLFRNLFHLACHEYRDISFLSHTVYSLVLDPVTCCHRRWHQVCISNPCPKATAGRNPEFFCFPDRRYSAFGLWSLSYLGANKKGLPLQKPVIRHNGIAWKMSEYSLRTSLGARNDGNYEYPYPMLPPLLLPVVLVTHSSSGLYLSPFS